jgi:hypothetical protein
LQAQPRSIHGHIPLAAFRVSVPWIKLHPTPIGEILFTSNQQRFIPAYAQWTIGNATPS